MAVYDEVNAPGRLADVAGRYTQYAGAAVSLSLMIGVAVWGTQTIMRDVSGVPVVRAAQGDMRVAPADPGGDVATHRGLAVNTVAGLGEAAAPEDTVTLAPRTVDLVAEDLDTAPLETAVPEAEVLTARADTTVAATLPAGPMNADDILALADQISAGVAPLTAIEDEEDGGNPVMTVDGEAVDATEIANIDAEDPIAMALAEAMSSDIETPVASPVASGLRTVIRPVARPMQAVPAVATAADLVPAPVVVAAVAEAPALPSVAVTTDDLPVGTKLVQLGAFPTPEDAAQEWTKLQTRFGDLLSGKAQVIQQASSGGAVFYRLRASGFDELADARAFCDVMDAGRAACTPVVVR